MSAPALKDYIQLHFIVLIWGFTAILGLLISIPAVELVFYRTLLAFLLLGVVLLAQKKSFVVEYSPMIRLLGTGFLIGIHWILFFAAARVSNASVCLAGMATCSLWTSILEPIMHKRRISMLELFLGSLVIVGLYVIFHFEFNHALGLLMAIASALMAAIFSIINSQFTTRHDSLVITFYEMIGAFICTALFLPFYGPYLSDDGYLHLTPTWLDWLYIGILAFVCTVYAYSESVKLMKKFTPFAINLTVNLEPVYGIILAVLIFGNTEKMTLGFYLGTIIILISVLLYPILSRLLYKRKVSV